MNRLVFCLGILFATACAGQSIQGVPSLNQLDSTTFELTFATDSAAILSVHVAEDTTYRSAFIFLGRTAGTDNQANVKLEGLRNNTEYVYRILLGTELKSPFGGSFKTGSALRK